MQRVIPDPGFAGDDGTADEAVTAALASYAAQGRVGYPVALAALQEGRVLVPVVAVLGDSEVGADGLRREKDTDMAAVLLTGRDGRRALLAFTGLDALRRWDPAARPVPVTTQTAARAACQEQAAALVVDVAGPVTLVVDGADLRAVASGWRLGMVEGQPVWIGPADG